GREPGISLLLITQIPNKLHSDALAQADLVIAHHLTSEADMKALRGIMQTYAMKDIEEYMNALPRKKGVALVLDDNSERIYTIQIRPRLSWHAGGSPLAIKRKGLFDE
ncbi:MAG TPA: ATP-binding protein, partial [archaeon]|nr:ATP-binding protein [archaeon]